MTTLLPHSLVGGEHGVQCNAGMVYLEATPVSSYCRMIRCASDAGCVGGRCRGIATVISVFNRRRA